MRKLFVILAAAGTAYVLWRKAQEERAERDLWAEVTDPLTDGPVTGA